MAHTQQKFRELLFQLLFSQDFSCPNESETAEMLTKQLAVTASFLRQATAAAKAVAEKLPEIDRKIASLSQGYEFDRIQRVERTILRLGVYELLFDEKIPSSVVIAEAIRLARKFATPEAANFINAILDAVLKSKNLSLTPNADALR